MLKSRLKSIIKKTEVAALKYYLSGRFSEHNAYILTSSPRSGSTLLGQVLSSIPKSCTLFEPLHLAEVPEAEKAGFSWRTFVEPQQPWPQGKAFLQQTFEGRTINEWTAREMSFSEVYNSQRLIIKFVRANRLLPWLCENFDIPAPILLIRHPCAVVASQLNFGWEGAARPEPPVFLNDHPVLSDALAKASTGEEYLAALWALDQLPIFLYNARCPWIILTYEELVLYPEKTLKKVIGKWDLEIDMQEALSRIKKPSSVVSKSGISGISGWKHRLSEEEASRILKTVHSFGLSFYTDADEADYSLLSTLNRAELIKQAKLQSAS